MHDLQYLFYIYFADPFIQIDNKCIKLYGYMGTTKQLNGLCMLYIIFIKYALLARCHIYKHVTTTVLAHTFVFAFEWKAFSVKQLQ